MWSVWKGDEQPDPDLGPQARDDLIFSRVVLARLSGQQKGC